MFFERNGLKTPEKRHEEGPSEARARTQREQKGRAIALAVRPLLLRAPHRRRHWPGEDWTGERGPAHTAGPRRGQAPPRHGAKRGEPYRVLI